MIDMVNADRCPILRGQVKVMLRKETSVAIEHQPTLKREREREKEMKVNGINNRIINQKGGHYGNIK